MPKAKKLTVASCGKVFAPSGHHIFNRDAKARESIKVISSLECFPSLAKVSQALLVNVLVFLIWSENIVCICDRFPSMDRRQYTMVELPFTGQMISYCPPCPPPHRLYWYLLLLWPQYWSYMCQHGNCHYQTYYMQHSMDLSTPTSYI